MITWKRVNFHFNAFCLFRVWFWTWQHDPFHTKIDKFWFVFKKSYWLWVFSRRIWNVLWMRFSLKNFLHHLKKWRDDPEITKKLFFCFIFGLKISSNVLSRCLRMLYGTVVSRRFYKDQWKNILVRIRSNHVLRLKIFSIFT